MRSDTYIARCDAKDTVGTRKMCPRGRQRVIASPESAFCARTSSARRLCEFRVGAWALVSCAASRDVRARACSRDLDLKRTRWISRPLNSPLRQHLPVYQASLLPPMEILGFDARVARFVRAHSGRLISRCTREAKVAHSGARPARWDCPIPPVSDVKARNGTVHACSPGREARECFRAAVLVEQLCRLSCRVLQGKGYR